jgi:hypothetical protein
MPEPPEGHVYVLPPIDYWTGWSTADDAVPATEYEQVKPQLVAQVKQTIDHALEQFRRRTGWEGDIREGPFVVGLPPIHGGSESDLLVAIKQDNNGMVFVWSPHELGYLADFLPERRS